MWSRAPPLLADSSAHRRIVHARPHGTQNVTAQFSRAPPLPPFQSPKQGGPADALSSRRASRRCRRRCHRRWVGGPPNRHGVPRYAAATTTTSAAAAVSDGAAAAPQLQPQHAPAANSARTLRSCSHSTPQHPRVAPVPPESVVAAAGRAGPLWPSLTQPPSPPPPLPPAQLKGPACAPHRGPGDPARLPLT
jgi:hypothetical protein